MEKEKEKWLYKSPKDVQNDTFRAFPDSVTF